MTDPAKVAEVAAGLTEAQRESMGFRRISDAEAIEIWRAIETLTDGEGDTVTVLCPNPDFNGQPNYAIECNGSWTGWRDLRFAHDSQVECFRLAVRAHLQENNHG